MTNPNDDVEKAAKRHCWDHTSLSQVYEHGFIAGSAYQKDLCAKEIAYLTRERDELRKWKEVSRKKTAMAKRDSRGNK